MSPRPVLAVALLILWPAFPAARGQHAEEHEHETERIGVPSTPDTSGKRPDLAAAAKQVVEQTNAFRKKEGRGPVAVDQKLTATAQEFATFMAGHDEYGHRADGRTPAERVKTHGYDYCLVAENIAYEFDSRGFDTGPLAAGFVNGWEKSPPHRRNMLDPDVTQTGVAVARSERTGYYYAVQLFARPASAAVVFRVENRADEAVRYAVGGKSFDLPPRVTRTHTRARPAELTFAWPGGGTAKAKAAGGERFTVVKEQGAYAVKKE